MEWFGAGAVGTDLIMWLFTSEVKANARAALGGSMGTGEGGVTRADSAQIGVKLRLAMGSLTK
jgi:hypothetical protein